jgi:Type VI secretion system (T6SS), amidase effector protein 4
MEAFFDPDTKQPVQQIEVREGVTKILGLKKFAIGEVAVRTGDYKVGLVDMVIRLKDKSKLSYDRRAAHLPEQPDQHQVAADSEVVESNGAFYFQICGNGSGTTELTARFTKPQGSPAYASPVTITVTKNAKLLDLGAPFTKLWHHHPYNPVNKELYKADRDRPCPTTKWVVGQCMVRFCTALHKGNVNTTGLSVNRCGLPGPEHQHHFIDPYDFEKWKGVGQAYVFEAKPPLQVEPMPGIAAYYFTMNRTGVIVFREYFATNEKKTDMAGGHIDLWNNDQMGNTFGKPHQDLSAFVRSRRIVFWPLA